MKIIGSILLFASLSLYYFIEPASSSVNIGGFELDNAQLTWIERTESELSLYEKCAQLVIPYAYAFDTSAENSERLRLIELVKKYKVGGFLFLDGTLEAQIETINKLQSISKVPLLISADYERGPGSRLSELVEFPYNMALGAADDPHLTYLVAKATAEISRKIGVHQNYAPLVDVNTDYRNPIINIRSFAENPFNIAVHATEFIRGLNEGGMISTAKHFPGHGSTDIDSHSELPVINKTKFQIEENDLVPFRESIDAGVKSIMIGHLDVPAFEKEESLPATFSKNIVNKLLTHKLGFKGLIVTDAFNMNSIADNYSQEEAAVKAIEAGNDLILFPANDSAVVTGLYNAVLNKRISINRINKSLRKLLAAKSWLGLQNFEHINYNSALGEGTRLKYNRLARNVAEKSITLVKDLKSYVPLKSNKRIASIALTDLTDYRSIREPLYFNELVENKYPGSKTFKLHLKSRKRDYRKAKSIAKKADVILLPVYMGVRSFKNEIGLPAKYVSLIKDIAKLNKPLIVVSFGNPYLLKDIKDIPTYLCAYGSVDVSEEATLKAIAGEIDIKGKLPVSITGTEYSRGSGIIRTIDKLITDTDDSLYNFSGVERLMNEAIEDSVFPGAVLLVGKGNRIIFHKAFGHQTYDTLSPKTQTNFLFDLASVSKVVGTTSAAMMLYDKGLLDLDKKVVDYLPEFNNQGKDKILVRNLLLHNAGLKAWIPFYKFFSTRQEVIDSIMNTKLEYEPGTKYVYSDLGMITLQQIIERLAGKGLDEFLTEKLFSKLNMKHTMYNPPEEIKKLCMPTEVDNYWRMDTIQGKVHDETAYLLNGVAGHAGLFSTAEDISHLIFTLLNKGKFEGKQIFNSKTVENWTTKQTDQSTRGLGWDTKSKDKSSAGHFFSMKSFGHTGFTGTSVWADKENGLFVILLTNRVYPTRANRKIIKFRPVIHDAIYKAVTIE